MKDVYEIKSIEIIEEDILRLVFEDVTHNVFTKHINDEEIAEVINFVSESKKFNILTISFIKKRLRKYINEEKRVFTKIF